MNKIMFEQFFTYFMILFHIMIFLVGLEFMFVLLKPFVHIEVFLVIIVFVLATTSWNLI